MTVQRQASAFFQAAYPSISDYGLIGDCHTAALVSRDGSIDWLCAPRFDSPSLFARLLDAGRGGCFAIRPEGDFTATSAYMPDTSVLVTTYRTESGVVTLTDFMPIRPGSGRLPYALVDAPRQIVRLVEGIEGEVNLRVIFQPRPNFGASSPAMTVTEAGVRLCLDEGHAVHLRSSCPLTLAGGVAQANLPLSAGQRLALVLDMADSPRRLGGSPLEEAASQLAATRAFWHEFESRCTYRGHYQAAVMRSIITLKLLTYAPTGAMVAAPTTSLPEAIGGVRNWDYRYAWIRDASLASFALLQGGHPEDGQRFLEWVCELALHCEPGQLQIMYGIGGEPCLPERVLDHLEGYRGSAPVRVGNEASEQFQLDVYGELLDCFHTLRRFGRFTPEALRHIWPAFQRQVEVVAARWREPDSGIWEVRSGPHHFVYSKVMAWVALDRGIKAVEDLEVPGDLEHWRGEREAIRAQVLEHGYDAERAAFTRSYGEHALDAANLMLPLVHFIDAGDARMRDTVAATERELLSEGLVYRYRDAEDGLPGGEATFGVCTFWLIDNMIAQGRLDEAGALFEKTLARATSLGLYAEELEPRTGEHLGNFPQALTHIGLVNSAVNLARARHDARLRHPGREATDVGGSTVTDP